MNVKVFLPTQILIDRDVVKVAAEALNGAFVLKPRHIDFVTALVPGIVTLTPADPEAAEEFLAIDEGILVKQAQSVSISVRNAVQGTELGRLQATVNEQFRQLNDQERRARSVIARFEADFARRFLELEA